MLIKIYLTCFLSFSINSLAQDKKFGEFTFRMNEVTHQMFLKKLDVVQKQNLIPTDHITQFAAVSQIITPLLREAGIPEDFQFLCIYNQTKLAEHSILSNESGVFWCFTPESASRHQLKINDQVDERKYLRAATEAFIHRLYEDYSQNLNWGTTLVKQLGMTFHPNESKPKEIGLSNTEDEPIVDFLVYKSFIENSFLTVGNRQQQTIYEFQAAEGRTLGELAEILNLDIFKLMIENQWLLSGKVPKQYALNILIPIEQYYEIKNIESGLLFDENTSSGFPVLAANPGLGTGRGGIFYTINGLPGIQAEMGDKFVNLAYKANLNPDKFLKYNDLKASEDIYAGEIYYLQSKRKKAALPFHVTQPQETLWSISQQYGVVLEKLVEYNRFDQITKLNPGQIIWMKSKRPKNTPIEFVPLKTETDLPQKKPVKMTEQAKIPQERILSHTENTILLPTTPYSHLQVTEEPKLLETTIPLKEIKKANERPQEAKKRFLVHSVLPGETLKDLSAKYEVSISRLKELNNLTNTKIEPGDKIIIKKN